jgi:biotin carboxyl carrier protein
VSRQGYAVIVVAEGAGESLLNEQQRNTTSSSSGADDKKSAAAAAKGGSNDSPAFGLFLKTQIEKHFVSKGKQVRIYMCVCIVHIV